MSALPWAVAFVFLGIGIYLVAPVAVGPSLPDRHRTRVANHYFRTAMLVLDRALLVARKHGGYSLVPSSYDAGMEAETVTIGGEDMHFEDPYEFTTSLYKRRFGLADEERNVVINPRLAELGWEFYRFYHEGEHEVPVVVESDDRETDTTAFTSILTVPEHPTMVNLREARWLIPGSASPKLAESVKDDIEKSQHPYKSRNYIDLMIGLVAMGVAFGMVVLADYLVGINASGAVPKVNIGLMLWGVG